MILARNVLSTHTLLCTKSQSSATSRSSSFRRLRIRFLLESSRDTSCITADRYLTNRVVPGSRCTVMGIFSIYQSKGSRTRPAALFAIRTPYLRAGRYPDRYRPHRQGQATFTEEEEQEFLELSRRENLYETLTKCIAPSIYGSQDIEKATPLLPSPGRIRIRSSPTTDELRGDINVL